MGKMERNKGQRAEREVLKLLQPVVTVAWAEQGAERFAPQLERNLIQSHKGGHDIAGLDWLAIEVKHCETFALTAWWGQCKAQALRCENVRKGYVDPVLFYRRNNVAWRIRMFGYLGAGESGRVRCPVDIELAAFMAWFDMRVRSELKEI